MRGHVSIRLCPTFRACKMSENDKKTNHGGDHCRRSNVLNRKFKLSSQGYLRRKRRPNVSLRDGSSNLGTIKSGLTSSTLSCLRLENSLLPQPLLETNYKLESKSLVYFSSPLRRNSLP